MLLSDEMLREARDRLVTIPDDATLINAAEHLSSGTDLVAVCNPAGTLAGVISKTDVVARISVCQGATCTAPASTVMSRDVARCRATDRLEDIARSIRERNLKNIPIVDDRERPIGMITARQVLGALLEDAEFDEARLMDYVKGIGYR